MNGCSTQVPITIEDHTAGSYDPWAVPAYGKGPKLLFDQLDDDQKRVVNLATMKRRSTLR